MLVNKLVTSREELDVFLTQVMDKTLITLDAEGVDLSRVGTLELISIGFQDEDKITKVYLFDLSPATRTSELQVAQIAVLKQVLECPDILKIIHDCHQDSDALNAQLGIKLTNVFDTLVWNKLITKASSGMKLNDTLQYYNCAINEERVTMKDIYKINPAFWAQRPLTSEMLAYASGDVAVLFDLHQAMLQRTEADPELQEAAQLQCQIAVTEYRNCAFQEFVVVPAERRGKVIGRQGAGIRVIESYSGAFVAKCNDEGFLLLATDAKKLAKAKKKVLKFAA